MTRSYMCIKTVRNVEPLFTKGKIYIFRDNGDDYSVTICCDCGDKRFNKGVVTYFIPLEEHRLQQIEKIL